MTQLVLVVWNDAWADTDNFASLHGIQQSHHPLPVQTLGWLLADDSVGISLANERSSDSGQDTYRGRTFIPRAMVQSVTPFTMSKRKVKPINVEVIPAP